jgi:hypothetical protein
MGTFNTLRAVLACPRCGAVGEVEVELRFGNTAQMQELFVGDRYPWVAGMSPQHKGRPEGGNMDGQGYMECEQCHKDSFQRVIVREDIIVGIEPNREKRGYIAD